jgi:hypothetical protein
MSVTDDDVSDTRAGRACAGIFAGAVLFVSAVAPAARADDFSATEGLTASGAPTWKFELSPFGWLPKTNINAGLGNLPDKSVTIPIGDILSNLTGGFMGEGVVRYGNFSGELNFFWVALGKNQIFETPGPLIDSVNVRLHAGIGSLAPGLGYRVIASDSHKLSLDARAGFTYAWVNTTAHIQDSPAPGTSGSSSFIQPWIGTRLSYFPTPRWRVMNNLALTGLGVDGGRMGWNAALVVSYLINPGFDVTAGYRAVQSFSSRTVGPGEQNLSVEVLDYGPVIGAGFRF